MAKTPTLKRPRFTSPAFRKHAVVIGQLVIAWNALHEELANIFLSMLGRDAMSRALGIWNSAKFDLPRREMLKAAAKAARYELSLPEQKVDDIVWVVDQATKLENLRNNAVHSPLVYLRGTLAEFTGTAGTITASVLYANPRSIKLLHADVLPEFTWYRDMVVALHDYADVLALALRDDKRPWPKKPSLPTRQAKRKLRNKPRQARPE